MDPRGFGKERGGLRVPVQEREMPPECRTGLCGNNRFRCGWKLIPFFSIYAPLCPKASSSPFDVGGWGAEGRGSG